MVVASNNPLLDHRKYEVEYINRRTEVLKSNIIAENLFSQVYYYGRWHLLIYDIYDHRVTGEEIPRIQEGYTTRNGIKSKNRTT